MKSLYPRTGIFRTDTGQYKLPEGWLYELKELEIIGESKEYYEYRRIGDGRKLSIHRTHLHQWKTGQQTLFPR